MPERYIVAFEIGSSKIRGAVAITDDAGMTDVVAVEEDKLIDLVRYGCVQNMGVATTIDNVIQRLESYPRLNNGTITGCYVSLGGKSLKSHTEEVSITLPAEMEITPQLVADLKAKAQASVGDSRDVVDVVPVRFTVDNKEQINPIGTYGQQLGATTTVITCSPQIKRMLRRVFCEKLGLDINGYIVRPLAEGAMALTDDERRLGCMFVDFGAETTTVAIYRKGALVYLATIPLGSRNITKDLTTLNYIEERAEEIKRLSGNAIPAEGVHRPGTDGIDYTEVNNYVHARAAEILQNILAQVGYAGLKLSDLPGGIIIAGGGAKLRGFTDLLAQHSKLKVRMGSVQGGVRISDGAVHPADNLDVISLLVATSRLPQEQCVEFPAEEAPESDPDISSYEDLNDDEDASGSRIGHLDDDEDDDENDGRKGKNAGKDKDHKKGKKPIKGDDDDDDDNKKDHDAGGLLATLSRRLSGIWTPGDDTFK